MSTKAYLYLFQSKNEGTRFGENQTGVSCQNVLEPLIIRRAGQTFMWRMLHSDFPELCGSLIILFILIYWHSFY
jgi:hypothetical protein